jgi:uncharacterized protein with HEPN domain
LPRRDWRLRIDDMLDAIVAIQSYVTGLTLETFQADRKTIDAVVRNLEVLGEAARRASKERSDLPADVPWVEIAGMRNILIHEYFGIDVAVIWQTVVTDLPPLAIQLRSLRDE